MKTSCKEIKCFIFSLFLTGCFFLTTSCGLDMVYYISSPENVYHRPEYSSNFEERYFGFYTNEINDFSDFAFLGTYIYYKIYSRYDDPSSSSDLMSEKDTLYSLSVSDNTTSAATKMIDTYKYQPLKCYDEDQKKKVDCIIPADDNVSKKKVFIRLTDYQDISEYRARVSYEVNGKEVQIGTYPIRNNYSTTFNFGRSGETDKKPVKNASEEDVSYTDFEPRGDDTFYVALFAVAAGRDTNYTQYYSNILYLGCVPINSNEKDN